MEAQERQTVHEAAHQAIAAIEAGRPVVCTMEAYYATVRLTLQRYAVAQAAMGHPEVVAQVTGEIRRLDTAQAAGRWPGAYHSRWERLLVGWATVATRFLGRRYYRRAHGVRRPLVVRILCLCSQDSQEPLNCGGRLALKASTASRWSSVLAATPMGPVIDSRAVRKSTAQALID